jgi:acyl-CoA synthetase (AMP-forming)/AMP-acid ligase II
MNVLNQATALKRIVVGSSPVTRMFASDMQNAAPGIELAAVYAMTEVAPIAVADGHAISAYRGQGDLVGKPLSDIDITIDSSGEILVSGPRVGRYLGSDQDQVSTGDLGHLTAQGDLVLDGRSKDMILAGARNIYPQHHETRMAQIQGINEVVLIGRRDAYGDEDLWLLIDTEPGIDHDTLVEAIITSAHSENLPIHGIVLDTIPRSGRSHKTDRIASRRILDKAMTRGTAHILNHRD